MDAAYHAVASEIRDALEGRPDGLTAAERAVVILKERLPHYTWVGVYLLQGDELVLGPYRGKPSPHVRIPLGRGICGAAAAAKKAIIVDDVNSDPRYLACSLETRSEIVVPILRGDQVLGEIDIDGDRLAAFTEDDRLLLQSVAALLAGRLEPARRAEAEGDASKAEAGTENGLRRGRHV
jgi:L-methionine (R)-S-oxide reductase